MAIQYFSVPMSGEGGFEFRVAYDSFPQGDGNLVAATIQWRRTGSYGYGAFSGAAAWSLAIGGAGGSTISGTINFSAPAGGAIDWQWVASHQAVITGTSASISASLATGTQGAGTGSFSTLSVPLVTASRSSFSEVAGPAIVAFDAGRQITIHTNRQSTAYTHNLIVSFGGTYETIATGVGASFNWTPPLSLLTQIPSSLSGNGYVRTETYNGSTYLGRIDSVFTLRAGVGVIPVVSSVVATEQNSSVASIVGLPVQSLSSLALNVNASGVQGSTIIAREATFQGATVPTGTIVNASQAGTLPVTGKATDSRGRQSATWSGSLTVLPYSLPVATSLQARRANVSNVADENGAYLRVDLSAAVQSLINSTQRNSLTVRVFTRPHSGGAWTARNVIVHGSLTYNSSFQVTGGAIFSGTSSWDVQVRVEDKFAVYTEDTVVSSTRVPIDVNQTSVGIGKMHEQGALDVGAGGIFDDGMLVINSGDLASDAAPGIVELATQAEADAGTDASKAMTPKQARDAIYSPHAEAAGTVTVAASGVTTVTFPVGRFTQVPVVTAVVVGNGNVCVAHVGIPTTSDVVVRIFTIAGGQTTGVVHWTATQMRSGSASG